MRILLIGEYSRLHLSLSEGLKALGHEVVVASDGDGLKKYPRNIDLTRKSSNFSDTISSLISVNKEFAKFDHFDVVQLINPCFLTQNVTVNRYYFNQLKKNNKKVFLGAFGDDSYWVRACLGNQIFKYSEFFVNGKSTQLAYNSILEERWINSSREKLNDYITNEVDGVVACLYEYFKSYEPYCESKLKYIALPVNLDKIVYREIKEIPDKVKFFIGINKDRSEYKGTDVMHKVLLAFAKDHPNEVEVLSAESVTYDEYQSLMIEAHVVLDQLYSHSPAMNALLAMAQGKVVMSGGEPEMYDLMGNVINRPIINVFPTEENVYSKLDSILKNKDRLPSLSKQSRLFVEQYHDCKNIAQQYVDFWNSKS